MIIHLMSSIEVENRLKVSKFIDNLRTNLNVKQSNILWYDSNYHCGYIENEVQFYSIVLLIDNSLSEKEVKNILSDVIKKCGTGILGLTITFDIINDVQ